MQKASWEPGTFQVLFGIFHILKEKTPQPHVFISDQKRILALQKINSGGKRCDPSQHNIEIFEK
jgi:hypothetical protein